MKNIQKIFLALLFITFISTSLYALEAESKVITSDQSEITVMYNKTACPGDAIFIKLKINSKKNKSKDKYLYAEFVSEEKVLEKSDFYASPSKKKNEYFTGVPLSSFITNGEYVINIVCRGFEDSDIAFTIPVTIESKDFDSYTIPISEDLQTLREDTSTKKVDQSKKLNDTIALITSDDVYHEGAFSFPVKATRRTSPYAQRRYFEYPSGKKSKSLHCGIDFGVPNGTEVYACGSGKVVMATNRITTGYSVIIEHLPGLYSIYYHLSELKVKQGQMVKSGDLIALSGDTGFATGPHLHWEVRLNSVIVNPDFLTTDFTFNESK